MPRVSQYVYLGDQIHRRTVLILSARRRKMEAQRIAKALGLPLYRKPRNRSTTAAQRRKDRREFFKLIGA